ncbi:MAG: pyridine nucleotide-disulfide oxidoreductase, partial [Caulobacteraceae bacterium]|nr:pyridine nucleotide-disulfide oxidoreductase [Caulobacteraceae bacterium]
GRETLSPELCAPDPWDGRALDIADPEAPVLLMGTGLTMVDVALNLAAGGHRGPIIALSRRGLVPHRHAEVALQPTSDVCCPLQPLSQMLRGRRRRAGEVGWRAAVDELRPYTQDLWRQADPVQRRRFLRHLRPWWDVHRHRMAPQVAGWLEDLRARGGLTVAAGRFCAFTPEGEGLSVTWRPRGEARARILRVGKIINCTGAGGDLSRTPDPLLRDLIAQGSIRADALGLGLEVDGVCQAIGASGRPTPGLYAAGPITQGYSWEVVAVPDIRNQVAQLAALLAERLEPEI